MWRRTIIDCPRIDAMFRLRKTLKLVTTLPLVVAIVTTGFAPVTRASGPCIERDGVKLKRSCATSGRCCCAATAESRTCCCRQDKNPPPPPLTAPNDPERTLKLVPWVNAPSGEFVIITRERASLPYCGGFYSPLKRSVQTLLCVWRI